MYLLVLSFGLCLSYIVLLYLFLFFFENKKAKCTKRSFLFIGLIFFLSILGYIIAFRVPDPQWGNRLLHGLDGGFLTFFICFLVTKDSKLSLGKFQFFVFSALMVTALGVGNEILEFFMQKYFGFLFSTTVNDTWLDLLSNTVGIAVASICFVPFVKAKSNFDKLSAR